MFECSTINQFPRFCEGEVIELVEENLRKVFERLNGGQAFQNPLGDSIQEVNDKLSELTGLTLINQNGERVILDQAIEQMRNNIADFKSHTDTISGIGDNFTDFIRRFSIANVQNRLKQQLGGIGDSFENLYGSIMCDAEEILTDTITQAQIVINAVGLGDEANAVLEFANQVTALSNRLVNKINTDINNLLQAERYLSLFGLANLLVTDDCRVQVLLGEGIGTIDLVQEVNDAIEAVGNGVSTVLDLAPEDPNYAANLDFSDSPVADGVRSAMDRLRSL